MHDWLPHIDAYLEIMITLEGRGESSTAPCSRCQNSEHQGQYRCLNCDNLGLMCQSCIALTHQHLPLHRIEARSFLEQIYIII
jgi:hypothetical protein